MDDMVNQSGNQNSIYVLNGNYNSYGDLCTYGHLNAAPHQCEKNDSKATVTTNPIEATCSQVATCSLQHEFKTFANGMTTNAASPVATSMTKAVCSPATAALQKYFTCSSSSNNSSGICQNVSQANQQHNRNAHTNANCHSNNNGQHPQRLSAASTIVIQRNIAGHEGVAAAGALLGSKKKCTNVKSTLIAKKTKFLKILEEEKWRSNEAATEATNCGMTGSNEAEHHVATTTTAETATTAAASFASQSGVQLRNNYNYNNTKNDNNKSSKNINLKNQNDNNHEAATSTMRQQPQYKLNNWSMNNDNNKPVTGYQQQEAQHQKQQQHESKQTIYKQQQTVAKSSYELYKEAADILGLSCTLCDNCRCLDCQSGYFDCDDDYDDDDDDDEDDDDDDEYSSYSEHAFMAEYVKYNANNDYDYAANQLNGMAAIQNENLHAVCYAVNCQQECANAYKQAENDSKISADEDAPLDSQQGIKHSEMPLTAAAAADNVDEREITIDFDLINATSSKVLENFETFNSLSLLDAAEQLKLMESLT